MNKFVQLAGVGGLVVFVFGFLVGSRYFGAEMSANKGRVMELQKQQDQLGLQTAELIRLGVTHDVDAMTMERLRQSVADLEERLSLQREELMLYNRLLKIANSEDGLHILDLHIKSGEVPFLFTYSFVIRQQAEKLKTISVSYSIQVSGHQNGEVISYTLMDLDEAVTSTQVKTKLKYFRVIEGVIKLPELFSPQNVLISAWSGKSSAKHREQLFPWP